MNQLKEQLKIQISKERNPEIKKILEKRLSEIDKDVKK